MKALPTILIFSALLVAITGCGKKNTSGKNNPGMQGPCIAYGAGGQCSGYMQGYTSTNGMDPNRVLQENPCINGGVRQVIQTQVQVSTGNGRPTIVTQNDTYVGVTSFGDVAYVIGNGTSNPTFIAHLCARPVSGQGMLQPQILVGDSTVCSFKYITAANMIFPDGSMANFRALSPGGSSARQKFSFCAQ